MQALVPVVASAPADALFAWRFGQPITHGQFCRDVVQLAERLPPRSHLLNLCSDRYRFAVGLVAALLRGQVSLLPPNHTHELIAQLLEEYPQLYCLTDGADPNVGLHTEFFPEPAPADLAAPELPGIPADQIAAIVFTSGSTGRPQPNIKTWGKLRRNAAAEVERLGITRDMALVGTVPPQHMYGLESTVLLATQGGAVLHGCRPFYPEDIRSTLLELPRPRALITTPVHLRALLANGGALPPVDFVLCATAPLSPQLAVEAEARFGAPLHEIYGCTEAGQVATRRPAQCAEWRTYRDVKLRQDAHGTWVAGGHVESEVLLSDVIELVDPQTFLLHGRSADMVNIAGKRTSLAHLNYHLNAIDGVQDGVFYMPDDEHGAAVTRLTAFVVAPGRSAENVLSALRARVDAVFLPRPLYFVEALPRNATGKLTRDSLARFAAECKLRAAAQRRPERGG